MHSILPIVACFFMGVPSYSSQDLYQYAYPTLEEIKPKSIWEAAYEKDETAFYEMLYDRESKSVEDDIQNLLITAYLLHEMGQPKKVEEVLNVVSWMVKNRIVYPELLD